MTGGTIGFKLTVAPAISTPRLPTILTFPANAFIFIFPVVDSILISPTAFILSLPGGNKPLAKISISPSEVIRIIGGEIGPDFMTIYLLEVLQEDQGGVSSLQ